MKIPLHKVEGKDVVPSRYRRMRSENISHSHGPASIIERLSCLNQLTHAL